MTRPRIRLYNCASAAIVTTIMLMMTQTLKSADYVTVATIGVRPSVKKNPLNHQETVDGVINFWRRELNQVIPYRPDLILLTECSDYPPGMSQEEKLKYLAVRKNQIIDYFGSVAKSIHSYIAFGMERLGDDGFWRNSSVLIDRQGRIAGTYDKNFPTMDELEAGMKAGNSVPVFECDFGRVVSAICFDLNFDELRQKYNNAKPNIILFSSMYHGGDALQSNWAYTSRSFFVGSMAFREIPSEIRDPLGDVLATSTNYYDFAVTRINLDYRLAHLDRNWEKLQALKEKYKETVTIKDPGRLGAVLITSENKTVSAEQMIKEFDIELLDHYFDRARKLSQQSLQKTKGF